MLRRLIKFFINNATFANLLTFSIVGLGIISIFSIRREVFPNINFDVITIVTPFPGASPEEVEKLITNPLESDLNEVDGVKRILSSSIEGRSGITVFLDPDQTTVEKGKEDIKNIVDKFNDLPEGAEDPVVINIESKNQPIIEASISANVPELRLREIAKQLESDLKRQPGVANIVIQGLRDVEIRVEANHNKMNRLHVSLEDLINALKRQNVSIPGGKVLPSEDSATEHIVRTVGDFKTLDDVRNTVVRANDLGQHIRVSDVADVKYELEEAAIVSRVNGLPSLGLTVLKKDKADAIDVVDQVKARLTQLKKTLYPELTIAYVNDFSYYIRNRLSIVTNNLLFGLAFVLILLPFLLPFRFAFIVAMGEPFAFLGAIILLYYTGNSINLISMIGLIIVSGILVDDSIVVSENAVRLLEKGHDPKTAAIKGTLQIFGPLTGSALSTASVFAAMAFVTGIFGKFIVQIPIAVLACLAVSLFECYFILPSHIAHWIKVRDKGQSLTSDKNIFIRFSAKSSQFWDSKVVPAYESILKNFIGSRYLIAACSLGFVLVTAFGAKKFLKFDLFPAEGVEIFVIKSEVPTGVTLDKHVEYLSEIEKQVAKLDKSELINFATKVGIQQQDPNDPNTRRGTEFGQVMVFLTPEDQRNRIASEIIEDLRKKIGKPEHFKTLTFGRLQTGPPAGKPVDIGVRAKEYSDILPAVKYIKEKLSKIDGVTDILDSYLLGKKEYQVIPNPVRAASSGLSVASIGYSVGAAFEGIIATKVRQLDEEQAVRVTLSDNEKIKKSSLQDIRIPNPTGYLVPLLQVADIKESQNLLSYDHEDHQRQVRVMAEVDGDKITSEEANAKIKKLLPQIHKKFPNVNIAFGGLDEDTKESLISLRNAFGMAVLSVFLILVAVFRNIFQPMVILMTVPMGIIAVIWAFIFHGLPMSFMGMLGIIALTGVIVNNAIVLIDFINQEVAQGASVKKSILEGSKIRARPIFLTTVTTVVGLLPTAYGLGGLDKFVVPIAMALGWGLMFGAVLNAFFFPVVLAILDDIAIFFSRFFGAKAH